MKLKYRPVAAQKKYGFGSYKTIQ